MDSHQGGHSTRTQRDVVAEAGAHGLVGLLPAAPFDECVAWAQIAQVHDPAYVKAVRTGSPRNVVESEGFRWSPRFATSVVHIWEGHLKSCRLALDVGLVMHPVSGAHHADRESGSGFCTFNFLVGGGLALLQEGRIDRVAVIDLDAHQGDGTWRMVAGDERFGLFDISGGSWCGTFETARVIYRVAHDARRRRHPGHDVGGARNA
jgi:acetoin utilization deacetylase AcuC-like enzyme